MAIKPVNYDQGKVVELPLAASQTFAKDTALVWNGSGYLASVADDGEITDYIALEAATSSTLGDIVRCLPARTSDILWEVDTESNTAAAQRGIVYQWATEALLDNAAAASANGFRVESVVGAPADKKVRGRFVPS